MYEHKLLTGINTVLEENLNMYLNNGWMIVPQSLIFISNFGKGLTYSILIQKFKP